MVTVDALVRLIRSGQKPYSDMEDIVGNVFVHILEFAGDGDWGGHWFSAVPTLDSVVHLDNEVVGRVEEVHFLESDPDTGSGEIQAYVILNKGE